MEKKVKGLFELAAGVAVVGAGLSLLGGNNWFK